MHKEYYVHIMTKKSRTLYTGVTNDLIRRVHEHKDKLVPGFTSKYPIFDLLRINLQYSFSIATGKTNQRSVAIQENRVDKFRESRMERLERRMVCLATIFPMTKQW